jgi:hypothetical protein
VTDDPVEWWRDLLVEYGPLANLAMFLLDAPVQSATCERIFKNYAAFHTKKRNQLGNKKVYKMTQVKYNMSSKYGSDEQTQKNQKVTLQKNKAISPIEHKKITIDDTTTAPMEEEAIESEDIEASSEEDVSLEVDEWLDLLAEMDEDDEAEEPQPARAARAQQKDNGKDEEFDMFYIDDWTDASKDEWPDWTDFDGHEVFKDWPQDNLEHRQKLKRKYGASYVRLDTFSLAQLCEPWKDSYDGFPSMEGSYGQEYST